MIPVIALFVRVGLSGRNDPYDVLGLTKAVTNDERPQSKTQAQQKKAIFVFRMIRVEELNRVLVIKRRSRFLERNAMLLLIRFVLSPVPFETQVANKYIVRNTTDKSKSGSTHFIA